MVMPLRYLDIDAANAPLPRSHCSMLSLDRAIVLVLIHPEFRYSPVDLARILFTWELQHPTPTVDSEVKNARKSYSKFAERRGYGSNPELLGSVWQDMVRNRYHEIALLMAELKQVQEANPGRVYCLQGEQLIPYPDPLVNLSPPLPPGVKAGTHTIRFRYETIEPEECSSDFAAVGEAVPQAPHPTFQDSDPAPELVAPDQTPALETNVLPCDPCPAPEVNAPPMQRDRNKFEMTAAHNQHPLMPVRTAWKHWQRNPAHYLRAAVWLLTVVPFLIGFNGHPRNVVFMEETVELAVPFQEPAYFIAKGVRYEEGDWVRLEDEEGVIMQITRTHIVVDDRVYPTRALIFMGGQIEADGNMVVYPGHPSRKMAGNFWVNSADDLDKVPTNYLSWLGGFHKDRFAYCDLASAGKFWQDVTKELIRVEGEKLLVIPEGTQFQDFLEQCNRSGAFIEEEKDIKVIVW